MRKPLEKAARVLLRTPRYRRCVQSRDQSVAVQPNPRPLPPPPLEPLSVECPFKTPGKTTSRGVPQTVETVLNRSEVRILQENNDVIKSPRSHESLLPFSSIPTPRELPLVGSLFDFIKSGGGTNIHEHARRRHEELGPIFKENIAGQVVLYVADPSLYNDVAKYEGRSPAGFKQEPLTLYNKTSSCPVKALFALDGEVWKRRRNVLLALMKRKEFESWLPNVFNHFEEILDKTLTQWSQGDEQGSGEILIGDNEIVRLNFEGFSSIVFGRSSTKCWKQMDTSIDRIAALTQTLMEENCKMLTFPAALAKKIGASTWKKYESSLTETVTTINEFAHKCTEELKHVKPHECYEQAGLLYFLQQSGMESEELHETASSFLVMTPDPLVVAAKWAFHCLGQYPEVQQEIYEEMLAVCGQEAVSYSHLQSLKSIRRTIKEILRLFPPAPFYVRILPEDSIIGDYQVPAGQIVAMSNYVSQRNPNFFPDPERFWPQRWSRDDVQEEVDERFEDNSKQHRSLLAVTDSGAFRPFGFGRRMCVGKNIAESMLALMMGRTVQQYHIKSNQVRPAMRTILVPDRPLQLHLKMRKEAR